MQCHYCKNPASVHLTKVVNKAISEMHLCEECAREKNLIPNSPSDLNVPAVLELAFGQSPSPIRPSQIESTCPVCGTPYAHFRAKGRLGCPHDYDVFRPLLEPILERVQNGSIRHVGKLPGRHRQRLAKIRREELESKLKLAIEAEDYEKAAKLRDSIKELGVEHEF